MPDIPLEFRSTALLALAAAAPFAIWFLIARERRRRALASHFVSERLRGVANCFRPFRPIVLGVALLASVVALAGPRYGTEEREVAFNETSLILLVDLSDSMRAEDVGTSRLSAARAVVRHLLARVTGRVALVAFEGTAEVVAPLTTDHDAVAVLLDSLGSGEMVRSGSDVGVAIRTAMQVASSAGAESSEIVLVSDGESRPAEVDDVLAEAKRGGVRISTIAIGHNTGVTIPDPDGRGALQDSEGRVVRTRVDLALMNRIARATGGEAFANPFGERDLERLTASLGRSRGRAGQQRSRAPIERYQWPLALSVAAFLVGSILHRGAE